MPVNIAVLTRVWSLAILDLCEPDMWRWQLKTCYRTRVRSLGMLVTNWLTPCCLVNLIDVTLACEDGNSKLVEVVTVVEVDDEKHVDNSLVQIWKINFGHKANFFQILITRFDQDCEYEVQARFEAGVWFIFCIWCFVEVMKLNLGQDSEARFGQYFEV